MKQTTTYLSTTIELGEDAELCLEVDIVAYYHEGEADTWDTPGYPAEVELDTVNVTSIGTGDNAVKRDKMGDAVKVLDAAVMEVVEREWEDHYQHAVMDDMDFEDDRY